jgi:hypothetical protein
MPGKAEREKSKSSKWVGEQNGEMTAQFAQEYPDPEKG